MSMEGWAAQLMTCVRVCWAGWLAVYLASCLALGLLAHLTLHLMAVGLLICLLTYFRLPPPNPSRVLQVLGPDPADNVASNQIGLFNIQLDTILLVLVPNWQSNLLDSFLPYILKRAGWWEHCLRTKNRSR
jgi:hypothetical protein